MLEFLKNLSNRKRTENGAVTLRSTGTHCLDLFATVGALRAQDEAEIERRFLRAWAENPDLAMKLLFYARDIRGGLGERRVFRVLLRWLAEHEKAALVRNLPHVAEYGRWDDLLVLLDTPARAEALALLRAQFEADLSALHSGGEVIVNVGSKGDGCKALFTCGKHYMLILAVDGDEVCILDPGFRPASNYLKEELKHLVRREHPFLYCSLDTLMKEVQDCEFFFYLFKRKPGK
jgi:hypothetical protein